MAIDPRDLIRRFRASYLNLYNLWMKVGEIPKGARLQSPKSTKIDPALDTLAIQALLDQYRKEHPDTTVTFYKFARTVDGNALDVVEDSTGLPEEDRLLTVSHTVTLLAIDAAHVITDVYVARLGRLDENPVHVRRSVRNP